MTKAYPLNAAGPFYVEDGCCLSCGVPHQEAPDLFAWDHYSEHGWHCFVKRQPANSAELTDMLGAMIAADVECIRYRGDDADVLTRLAEIGEAKLCDFPDERLREVRRNRVTFAPRVTPESPTHPAELTNAFVDYLVTLNASHRMRSVEYGWAVEDRYRVEPRDPRDTTVRYSWYRNATHTVSFEEFGEMEGFVAIITCDPKVNATLGIARMIDFWLRDTGRFESIRWFTEAELQARELGRDGPF